MSRSISVTAKAASAAAQTSEVWLMRLKIEEATLAEPITVICDKVNYTIGGVLYTAFPFRTTLPPEYEDRPPRIRLEIDNVDRTIVQAIRTMTSPPTITLDVVLASAPTVVEAGPYVFTLLSVDYDALVVSGELGNENVLELQSPDGRYWPNDYSGMF